MKSKFKFIYTLFFITMCSALFLSHSGGRSGRYANAPGESTCDDCHGGGSLDGSVELSNVPTSFVDGGVYPLTLTIKDADANAGGFQIVAIDEMDATNGTMIGSFSTPTNTRLNEIDRLVQSTPTPMTGIGIDRKVSWTFDWTAPASGAPAKVVFYYAGNAVNWTGGTGGDAVYSSNSSQVILPVELTGFSGKMRENTVQLTWNTASEKQNRVFEIERRLNNNQAFQKIGEQKGKGSSTINNEYDFTDNALPIGQKVVYYRLRQIDFDGSVNYSKTVSVSLKAEGHLGLYPTFVRKGEPVNMNITDNLHVEILNLSGQTVQKAVFTEGGQIQTSDLPAGRYFVRTVENRAVLTGSFIVL